MIKKLLILTVAFMLAAPALRADRRAFVWTYPAVLQAEGASELEFYQTTKLDQTDKWEYRIEIEQGLSPNWDLSIYQIFAQTEGDSFKWDAFQLRTRYRPIEAGRLPLDVILYAEYNRKIDLKKQNKLEGKLIMGRDFDRLRFAVNPVYEFFWAPGDPVHEIGLDIGLAYDLSYKVALGVESTTRHEFLKDEDNETGSYAGPTVSFASGSIYYTFGYAWGLTDDSNDARARFIMGIQL